MKLLLIIAALTTGFVLVLPKQDDLAGTWILDTGSKKCETSILRVAMKDGSFRGTLDIPDQQLYDRPVFIQLKEDSVRIFLDKNKACFIAAVVKDSVLQGESIVSGTAQPVRFLKLKE